MIIHHIVREFYHNIGRGWFIKDFLKIFWDFIRKHVQPELFNGKKWVGVSVKTANNSEDKISKNKKMIIQECQQKKVVWKTN